ncbi:hypothetical protein ACOBQB_04135 [Streptomyces sp. G5(2025)]|uniref:hypothetical protein n=1 Tax=Streptomyces sp. G5(2025) TaxID=3406628 RepID=UPI003C23E8AC
MKPGPRGRDAALNVGKFVLFAAASGDIRAAGRIVVVELRDAAGALEVEVTL